MTAQATPPSKPTPDRHAPRPGLRLRPARYVPLTPQQEREAIIARLLALVREREQDQQDPVPTPEP